MIKWNRMVVKKQDFLLNRAHGFLCWLPRLILQVGVPAGTKVICLQVMSHSSIMSDIIWLYTPWSVRVCSSGEHLHPLLLFCLVGSHSLCSSTQTWPGHADCCPCSYLCALTGNLPNPCHLSGRTSNSKPFISGLIRNLFLLNKWMTSSHFLCS